MRRRVAAEGKMRYNVNKRDYSVPCLAGGSDWICCIAVSAIGYISLAIQSFWRNRMEYFCQILFKVSYTTALNMDPF